MIRMFVIALAIGLFAVSCGGGGNKPKQGSATDTNTETQAEQSKSGGGISASKLVGTWKVENSDALAYEFKANGTGVVHEIRDGVKGTETFTWKIDGKEIVIDTETGGFNRFEFVGDNQLEDVMRQKFTKQ